MFETRQLDLHKYKCFKNLLSLEQQAAIPIKNINKSFELINKRSKLALFKLLLITQTYTSYEKQL